MDWNSLKQTLSPKQRFNRDVLWNIGSLAVLGVSGIVLNIVIGYYRGTAGLGIFNEIYAIYIVLSQLAVGGVHASVLKHVSHHQDDRLHCSHVTTSALVLGFVLSAAVCGIAYLGRDVATLFLDDPKDVAGLVAAIPGLLFFSLNKILLNAVNGLRNMRAFAVFNAMRFFLILIAVLVLLYLDKPASALALCFTIAEVLLFVGLLVYVHARLFVLRWPAALGKHIREHISFGIRGVFSGFIADLNTRVDVLMLGYFATDNIVGIYSMAAMLAEGFYQLPIAIQRNVNPIIGKCFAEDDRPRIEEVGHRIRRVLHPGMALLGLVAAAAYPLLISLFFPDKDFADSWPVFCILLVGVIIQSGFIPMGGILYQGGKPELHTLLMAIVIVGNAAMNAALIPLFGLTGAAVATGTAYILQAALLLAFAKRTFGVRLWR